MLLGHRNCNSQQGAREKFRDMPDVFSEDPISAVDNYRLRLERAGLGGTGSRHWTEELVLDDVTASSMP